MVQKYLVTGASGFIAMHVVDQLLKQGHHVRGTIRSLADKEKVDALKKLGPVELVEANLLDKESLRKAVKGIDVVMHVASPVPTFTEAQEEEAFIKPAVEGTLSVLQAALDENVKRVVVTSSTVTLTPFQLEAKSYSEKDWIKVENVPNSPYSGYQKSKILAEQAAWRFYEENKKKGKCFELSTVLPSLTLGPILSASSRSSVHFVYTLFNKKEDERVDDFVFPVCDVRDVALAHLRAAQLKEAVGKRFMVTSSRKSQTITAISKILREAGYKVADVNEIKYADAEFDNSNVKKILKIEPIDFKKSVLDSAKSLFNFGLIKK